VGDEKKDTGGGGQRNKKHGEAIGFTGISGKCKAYPVSGKTGQKRSLWGKKQSKKENGFHKKRTKDCLMVRTVTDKQ